MASNSALIKRVNEFIARTEELISVLPHGLEGQALAIEMNAALARARAALAAPSTPKATDMLQSAVRDCAKWLRLINAAKLVQSVRLDELLNETQGLMAALAGASTPPQPTPQAPSARRADASPSRRRSVSPPSPSSPRSRAVA